jgi:hypothetical protein
VIPTQIYLWLLSGNDPGKQPVTRRRPFELNGRLCIIRANVPQRRWLSNCGRCHAPIDQGGIDL